MEYTIDIKLKNQTDSKKKASISIIFGGCFVIRGISVKDSEKGLFVSMPSYKLSDGTYKDIAYPITAEFREKIYGEILGKYNALINWDRDGKM